eukprot:60034-Rhodomonas_salina.1
MPPSLLSDRAKEQEKNNIWQLRKQVGYFRDEIEVKKALASGDHLGAADRADLASKRKQVERVSYFPVTWSEMLRLVCICNCVECPLHPRARADLPCSCCLGVCFRVLFFHACYAASLMLQSDARDVEDADH